MKGSKNEKWSFNSCLLIFLSLESMEMSWYDAVHLCALPSAPWTATSTLTRPFLKPNVPLQCRNVHSITLLGMDKDRAG